MSLDIRALHRRGLLRAGSSFGWHWKRDDEPCGNIGVYASSDYLQLSYTWTPSGGEPRHMRYDVSFDRTRCHLGGSRLWFRCPWCYRRCAVLYGLSRDGYFACRLCLRLAYASEAEDTYDRLWRKERKLETRLVNTKGMRRRTFDRICEKLEAVEDAKDREFMIGALTFLRRSGMTLDELLK